MSDEAPAVDETIETGTVPAVEYDPKAPERAADDVDSTRPDAVEAGPAEAAGTDFARILLSVAALLAGAGVLLIGIAMLAHDGPGDRGEVGKARVEKRMEMREQMRQGRGSMGGRQGRGGGFGMYGPGAERGIERSGDSASSDSGSGSDADADDPTIAPPGPRAGAPAPGE